MDSRVQLLKRADERRDASKVERCVVAKSPAECRSLSSYCKIAIVTVRRGPGVRSRPPRYHRADLHESAVLSSRLFLPRGLVIGINLIGFENGVTLPLRRH